MKLVYFVTLLSVVPAIAWTQEDEPAYSMLVEWVEIDLADFHGLVGTSSLNGDVLRKKVRSLEEEGRAHLLQSLVVRLTHDLKGSKSSGKEFKYFTEFDPPNMTPDGKLVTLATPAAEETRHLGYNITYRPTWAPGQRWIQLEFYAESISFLGMREWGRAEARGEMPDFYNMSSNTTVFAPLGEHVLVSSHRPASASFPQINQPRVLLFIRVGAAEELVALDDHEQAQLALLYEVVETDQDRLGELLFEKNIPTDGPELRALLLQDVESNRATLIDAVMTTSVSGEDYKLISALEYIHPSEYDPPEISRLDGSKILPPNPAAFETRHVGLVLNGMLRVEPDIGLRGKSDPFADLVAGKVPLPSARSIVRLHQEIEFTSDAGFREFGQEESTVALPLFHRQRISHSTEFGAARVFLVGTVQPHQPAHPDRLNPVRLIFMRPQIQIIPTLVKSP